MLRLGILDFDTSHAVEFTRRLNHLGIEEEQWVHGARVVVGCAGTSQMAPHRIEQFTPQVCELGVRLVNHPEEMIGCVDGMLIVSLEGTPHRERARPFLEAGIPCFIDKPFTCSFADAQALMALSARTGTPVFSSSALRYVPELVLLHRETSNLRGAMAYGPGHHSGHAERNPGLFHYGIHTVEMLYTLLGPGCRSVVCTHEEGADVVTGMWGDGRIGTVRVDRGAEVMYGCLVFTPRGVFHQPLDLSFAYRELLRQVVEFFQSGRPPVDGAVTVELMGFLEAALRSGRQGGRPESVYGLTQEVSDVLAS